MMKINVIRLFKHFQTINKINHARLLYQGFLSGCLQVEKVTYTLSENMKQQKSIDRTIKQVALSQ